MHIWLAIYIFYLTKFVILFNFFGWIIVLFFLWVSTLNNIAFYFKCFTIYSHKSYNLKDYFCSKSYYAYFLLFSKKIIIKNQLLKMAFLFISCIMPLLVLVSSPLQKTFTWWVLVVCCLVHRHFRDICGFFSIFVGIHGAIC